MDTTGTPESGLPGGRPGAQDRATTSTDGVPGAPAQPGETGVAPGETGVAPGEDYSYAGGFGYGPGYGEPGDSGYGYGYGAVTAPSGEPISGEPGPSGSPSGEPGSGERASGAPGHGGPGAGESVPDQPAPGEGLAPAGFGADPRSPLLPPVVGPTPALRGLPGGPGIESAPAPAGASNPVGRRLQPGGSAWQRAQTLWRDAGVTWQRPVAAPEPAEAEWERIRARTPPGGRRAFRAGRGTAGGSGRPADATGGPANSAAADRAGTAYGIGAAHETGTAAPVTGAAAPVTGAAAAGAGQTGSQPGRPRRGIGRRTVLTGAAVVTAIAVLAAVGFVVTRASGTGAAPKPTHPVAISPYPPARSADADFTTSPALAARGVFQSLSAVASYGATVVAGGSEVGTRIGRTQFFASADGGRSWQLAPVTAANQTQPPAGAAPTEITAGPAGWLALGRGVAWTSKTGLSWRARSTSGITPANPGDQVLAVTATADGFLAAGAAKDGPVIWTSPDGITWQRTSASELRLKAPGVVHQIGYAAARGNNAVIAAVVTRTVHTGTGKRRRTRHVNETEVWRSADGGHTWRPAPVPVTNGALNQVSGVAPTGAGFVVVRPGIANRTGGDAVLYTSATGSAWRYAGQITAGKKPGLRPIAVRGSDQGAVVTARVNNTSLFGYVTADGRSWAHTGLLGSATATSLSGATVVPGGKVVAAGATTAQPNSRQGFLALASAGGRPTVIHLAGIRGATYPQRAVGALASGPGRQVAAGSANGEPAIWSAAPGGAWTRAPGTTPGVFGRPTSGTLAGVTYGAGGWLAVGFQAAGAARHPIVVFSRDGRIWQAADGVAPFAGTSATAVDAAYGPQGYVIVGERAVGRHRHFIAAAWHAPSLVRAKAKTPAKPSRKSKKPPPPPPLWTPAGDAGKGDLDGPDAPHSMSAVTAGAFGYVAVGQHGPRPAVWTSPDGRRWRLHDLPAVSGGGSATLRYVTASANRIVAAGFVAQSSRTAPLTAVSVDGGKTWREAVVPVAGGSAEVTGLTTVGGSFVAVGAAGSPGGLDVVVLTSPDGAVWRAVKPFGTGLSGPGVQAITALTAAQGQLLGAGFTATAMTEDPTLWRAPPAPAVAGTARATGSP